MGKEARVGAVRDPREQTLVLRVEVREQACRPEPQKITVEGAHLRIGRRGEFTLDA